MTPQETAAPDYMASTYFEYQQRYARDIKESDKILLDLIRPALHAKSNGSQLRLLDIGCSNGNLLRHLRAIAPAVEYWGGDIQPEVIQRCRSDSSLSGIRFEVMNARDLSAWPMFDIIIANALMFRFPEDDFGVICQSLQRALVAEGHLFALDFYHRFEQDVAIVERSSWHPEGLMLHMRSFKTARR